VASIRRFVDEDLNRQYTVERLADDSLGSYEANRAKVLNHRIGPKTSDTPAADFVIDLHSTTSKMGITIIFESEGVDPVALFVADFVRKALSKLEKMAPVFIMFADIPRDSTPHTPSLARSGVTIEVGPIAQGLLRDDVCRWTEAAAVAVMDALAQLNTSGVEAAGAIPVFQNSRVKVPCPCDEEGLPTAVFHEGVQDGDYRPLRTGDPLFRSLDGEVIPYDGRLGDLVFPVFVNEAAYYLPESGLGFALSHFVTLSHPAMRCSPSGVSRASLPTPPPDDPATAAATPDPWSACK
jgi:succinylglutamate desuccinylase